MIEQDIGLPNEPETKIVKLENVKKGESVILNYRLILPVTQSLNKGAPSFVAIYEKKANGRWEESKKINLSTIPAFQGSNTIEFSERIRLNQLDSDIAVYSTIYHCGSDHKTPCYIQGFKGKTQRSLKSTKNDIPIDFQITGWMN